MIKYQILVLQDRAAADMDKYQILILQDRVVADMDIKGALQILPTYAPANVG